MNHYIRLCYKVPEYTRTMEAMDVLEDYIYTHLNEFGCLPRDERVRAHIKNMYRGRPVSNKIYLMIRMTDEEAIATAADRSEYKHPEKDDIKVSERKALRKISKRKRSDSDPVKCEEKKKSEKKMKQSKCQICLDELDKKKNVTLECEHEFHYKCIKTWLGYKKSCPTCNQSVDLT